MNNNKSVYDLTEEEIHNTFKITSNVSTIKSITKQFSEEFSDSVVDNYRKNGVTPEITSSERSNETVYVADDQEYSTEHVDPMGNYKFATRDWKAHNSKPTEEIKKKENDLLIEAEKNSKIYKEKSISYNMNNNKLICEYLKYTVPNRHKSLSTQINQKIHNKKHDDFAVEILNNKDELIKYYKNSLKKFETDNLFRFTRTNEASLIIKNTSKLIDLLSNPMGEIEKGKAHGYNSYMSDLSVCLERISSVAKTYEGKKIAENKDKTKTERTRLEASDDLKEKSNYLLGLIHTDAEVNKEDFIDIRAINDKINALNKQDNHRVSISVENNLISNNSLKNDKISNDKNLNKEHDLNRLP